MDTHVDDKVARYVMGMLSDDEATQVLEHVQVCKRCAGQIQLFVRALSTVPSVLPEAALRPALRERLLASACSRRHRLAPFIDRLSHLVDIPPSQAAQVLRELDDDEWEHSPWPDLALRSLPGGPGLGDAEAGLARLRAGASVPLHQHVGDERYLVLQGRCEEEDGTVFGPGEVVLRPAGSRHAIQARGERDLLMAVVSNGVQIVSDHAVSVPIV